MQTEPQKPLAAEQADPLTVASKEVLVAKRSFGSWGVLRDRNYSLLFLGQLISSAGTQMQVVAVAWQVFFLTHSPVALGLIGLMEAVPRLIFSLVGGVLADVLDRRKMLMVVNLSIMASSIILPTLTSLPPTTIS